MAQRTPILFVAVLALALACAQGLTRSERVRQQWASRIDDLGRNVKALCAAQVANLTGERRQGVECSNEKLYDYIFPKIEAGLKAFAQGVQLDWQRLDNATNVALLPYAAKWVSNLTSLNNSYAALLTETLDSLAVRCSGFASKFSEIEPVEEAIREADSHILDGMSKELQKNEELLTQQINSYTQGGRQV